MGPISITNMISLRLELVDQFRELGHRFIAKKLAFSSMIVEQSGNTLQMGYKAHNRLTKFNRELYIEPFGQLQKLAVDERAGIRGLLENSKAELCEDIPLFSNNSSATTRRMKQHIYSSTEMINHA